MNASDLVVMASYREKPIAFYYPPVMVGPSKADLSAKEQDLL